MKTTISTIGIGIWISFQGAAASAFATQLFSNGRDSTFNTSSPIAHYLMRSCPHTRDFLPFEERPQSEVIGALSSSVADSWICGRDRGLRLSAAGDDMLQSSATLTKFVSHFSSLEESSSNALSVALWFTPEITSQFEQKPILTFSAAEKTLDDRGCPGYELQIAQYLGHLLIRYTDNDPARSCRIIYVRNYDLSPEENRRSNLFVLVLEEGSTSLFLNGQVLHVGLDNQFNTALLNWHPSVKLEVFGTTALATRFRGAVHELAFYDVPISFEEAKALYEEGRTHIPEGYNEITLTATPQAEAVTMLQGATDPLLIHINARNATSPIVDVAIEILELPSHLRLSIDDVPLELQDRLSLHSSGFSVNLSLTDDEFFNTPTIDANGNDLGLTEQSFTYRVLALDADGYVLGNSSATKQPLLVRHVNHALQLRTPTEAVESQEEPNVWICEGFQVRDELDFDLDRVRVDVTARNGQLSLASEFRHWADFHTCASRLASPWQCLGTGNGDRHMTFVAVPSHIPNILNGLQYEGFLAGQADEIQISIFDGAEGDCLSVDEHQENSFLVGNPWTSTYFDTCFYFEATIIIPAVDPSVEEAEAEDSILGIPNTDFSSFDLPDLIFWLIVAVLSCGFVYCCNRLRFCFSRGGRIGVDNSVRGGHGGSSRHQRPPVDIETITYTGTFDETLGSIADSTLSVDF